MPLEFSSPSCRADTVVTIDITPASYAPYAMLEAWSRDYVRARLAIAALQRLRYHAFAIAAALQRCYADIRYY